MELYVQVSFWMGVLAFVINMLCILSIEYPRKKTETIGEKLFAVIVGGGFVVWSGFILFS